jgi:hypothetical protein
MGKRSSSLSARNFRVGDVFRANIAISIVIISYDRDQEYRSTFSTVLTVTLSSDANAKDQYQQNKADLHYQSSP